MNIKERLKRRGYSLRRGAMEADIPYMTLHDIASGKTPMDKCSYGTLRKLADLLGTSVDWIVEETRGTVPVNEMHWDKIRADTAREGSHTPPPVNAAAPRKAGNGIAPEAAYFLERPEFLSASFRFFDDITEAVPLVPYYDHAVRQFYKDSWIREHDGMETRQEAATDTRGASEKALVYLENLYFDRKITADGFRFLAYAVAEKLRKDSLFPEYSNLRPDGRGMGYGIFAFYDFLVMRQALGYPGDGGTGTADDGEKHAIQANVDKIRTIMRGCRMSPGEVVIRCRPFFIYNGPAIRRVVDFVGNKASNMGHISTADTEKRKALYGLMEDTDDPRTDIWLRRFMEAAYLENPDLRLDMENGSGEGWTVLQADRRILGHPYQAEP